MNGQQDDEKKKFEKAFGLDMPFGEAVSTFGKVTKEELDEAGVNSANAVPEGEIEKVEFKHREVRRVFHDGEWWFSVVDVVGAISESDRPSKYWSDLKRQLAEKEGFSELSDFIGQLPLPGTDGKMYPTEVCTTQTLLRIIQSMSSKNAEPWKRWLARVGYERIQEIQNPEIAIKRAILTYQIQGRTDDWIENRIRSMVVRKGLTSEWKKRGIEEGKEYAVLTNVISAATYGGVGVEDHKKLKGIKSHHSLRDHMTDLELIFTMLGEKSTTEIAKARDAKGFAENLKAAKSGGLIAGNARVNLEKQTEQRVLSRSNFLGSNKREDDPIKLTAKKAK